MQVLATWERPCIVVMALTCIIPCIFSPTAPSSKKSPAKSAMSLGSMATSTRARKGTSNPSRGLLNMPQSQTTPTRRKAMSVRILVRVPTLQRRGQLVCILVCEWACHDTCQFESRLRSWSDKCRQYSPVFLLALHVGMPAPQYHSGRTVGNLTSFEQYQVDWH